MHYILKDLLAKNNLKLAVAESLTAGKVSDLIAQISGISEYYLGSVTSYTCDIKHSVLGVDKEWLDKWGPYNLETTRQMCDGIMTLMGADIVVATSGVAGPGNDLGSPQGRVWITVKFKGKYYDVIFDSLETTREGIRKNSAELALYQLEYVLLKENN